MLTLPRLLGLTRLDREGGQVMPMFALMVGALIFMAAVVVDGGNLFQNKQSLQNGADAAAIGAALYIADDTKSCAAGAADPIGAAPQRSRPCRRLARPVPSATGTFTPAWMAAPGGV
jgi:Flp pilus assembly protein TadG